MVRARYDHLVAPLSAFDRNTTTCMSTGKIYVHPRKCALGDDRTSICHVCVHNLTASLTVVVLGSYQPSLLPRAEFF